MTTLAPLQARAGCWPCETCHYPLRMRYDLDEVFVTGGEPTVTYVSRDEVGLERTVRRYLRTGYKALAVSGPSKSGKTVLVRKVLGETSTAYVTVTGASLDSIDDFWQRLAHHVRVPSQIEDATEASQDKTAQVSVRTGGGVIPVEATVQGSTKRGEKDGQKRSYQLALSEAVKERLREQQVCVLVDDFHYAPKETRITLAREIKDLIFSGVRVVLIAVPNRVMDFLESEGDLTGRVDRLRVQEWGPLELLRIATKGFEALNLLDVEGRIAARLVDHAFGSPLLMQELCREVCDYNEVAETSRLQSYPLNSPPWREFFAGIAGKLKPPLIDALQLGPTERRRRVQKGLVAGGSIDLYSSVLLGMGKLAPKRIATLVELSDAVTDFLVARPAMDSIRRASRKMAEIALESRGDGDVALDFMDSHPQRLSIVDPYLAFYIAWGLVDLGLPDVRQQR